MRRLLETRSRERPRARSQPVERESKRSRLEPVFPDLDAYPGASSSVGEQQALAAEGLEHPVRKLIHELNLERAGGRERDEVRDHGTWPGDWGLISRGEILRRHCGGGELGSGLAPLTSSRDAVREWMAAAAATSRRGLPWSRLTFEERERFQAAAEKHWKVWLDNQAVEVLDEEESRKVRLELERTGELDRIVPGRFVLTDKNDGVRTETKPMPLEASARIVIPRFKVKENLEGQIRRDAPTANRNSQHALFIFAGANPTWRLASGDVKAAVLKGDPYQARGGHLYMAPPDETRGPLPPLGQESTREGPEGSVRPSRRTARVVSQAHSLSERTRMDSPVMRRGLLRAAE